MSQKQLGLGNNLDNTQNVDLSTKQSDSGFFDKVKKWGTRTAVMLAIGGATLTSCKKAVFDKEKPQIHDLVSTTVTDPVAEGQVLEEFYVTDNKDKFGITVTGSSNITLKDMGGNSYQVISGVNSPTGLTYTITAKDSKNNEHSQDATVTVEGSSGGGSGTITKINFPEVSPAGTPVAEIRKADGSLDADATVSGEAGVYNDGGIVKLGTAIDGDSPVNADNGDKLTFSGTNSGGESINYNEAATDVESVSQTNIVESTPADYGTTSIPGGRKLYKSNVETWHADGNLLNPAESTNILYKKFLFGTTEMDTAAFETEANNPPFISGYSAPISNQAINQMITDGNMPSGILAVTLDPAETDPGYVYYADIPGGSTSDAGNLVTPSYSVILTKQQRQDYVQEVVHRMQEAGILVGFGVNTIDGQVPTSESYLAKVRFLELCRDNPGADKMELLGLAIAEQIP